MELLITGDVLAEDGVHHDVELWRRPFLGADHPHAMLAESRCRPRRYAILDMGVETASGPTISSPVEAGELFSLTTGAWGDSTG